MSYRYAATLFDTRKEAIRCLVEEFLWANGNNGVGDVIEALNQRDETVDELVENWDLNISVGDDRDEVTREEVAGAFSAIIAVKYADPVEDARLVYDEGDLEEIAREDPSLIVRINPA